MRSGWMRGARLGVVWCFAAAVGACSSGQPGGDAAGDASHDVALMDAADSSSMDAADREIDVVRDGANDLGMDSTALDAGSDGDAMPREDTPCSAGLMRCATSGGSSCVDLSRDPMNCGACGRPCCLGSFCVAGACAVSCGAGRILCGSGADAGCSGGGICVDPTTDPSNCGACGNACATNEFCQGAVCTAIDAGTDASADTGSTCNPVSEPPSPGGICDGRGRLACSMWAQALVMSTETAYATCVSATPGCARANRCTDITNPATCTCGIGPACGDDQVCVAPDATSAPSCQCIDPSAG